MAGSAGRTGAVVYTNEPLEAARLRLALFEAWDGRCSWCKQALRDASYMEIDHILPRNGFDDARRTFGLPSSFSVDDVENLAPICAAGRRCNREKSDGVADAAGAITKILERAAKRAYGVRRNVASMRSATGLERDLLHLLSAPLNEPATRNALTRHGLPLAQRLHALDPTLLGQYLSVHKLSPEIESNPVPDHVLDPDPDNDIVLTLDAGGRIAYTVADAVCGQDLDEAFTEGVELLICEIAEQIRSKGLDYDDSDGGFVLIGSRRLELEGVTFAPAEDELVFTLTGRIWSMHAASVVTFDNFGETLDGQRDVVVDGAFVITARAWLPFDEFGVEVDISGVRVERL